MPIRSEQLAKTAPKIKDLRNSLRMTQKAFAQACGVSQVQVSRWESQNDLPNTRAYIAISQLAPDNERSWWLEQAGLGKLEVVEGPTLESTRTVPLLKDAVAAGNGREINDSEIEQYLNFPKAWLPRGGKVVALRVVGDSMSPIINENYIVMVDTLQREPSKLVNKMVAARTAEGITIKWLRYDQGEYILLPHHVSPNHPVRLLRKEDGWGIVGEVVKWIGEPPKQRR